MPKGQCNGLADAPYPGKGVNQACAFKDARYLWQDGSYTVTPNNFPASGWVGKGGDTYLIRGSIGTRVSYRIGWNNPSQSLDANTNQYWGIQGDPYGSGIPTPPSGTPEQHTRILGENYASCHAASARTQLHGGYGVATVLDMRGASYVDVACLDITDDSSCGVASQANTCTSSVGSLSDYAKMGLEWSNSSTHDTLTDVRVHGLASAGMLGPTGDGMVFSHLDLVGNAASGWNADAGDGKTGTGSLRVEHYTIAWNGCAEEYPIPNSARDAEPYGDCTDDNSGGYGDGFGTATARSNPGWNVTFDQGTVFNNTQDGLDALHIGGEGSSMTVSRTLAYGNMGQQIKLGGAAGAILDNRIVTNCNALRQAIPGTPAGYNAKLSDFCRAADTGVLVTVNDQVPLKFVGNVIYSASATGIEIDCATEKCGSSSRIDFEKNVFVGFLNDAAHGYVSGGRGEYSNPIYLGAGTNPFRNVGSVYSGNTTFHANRDWKCPAPGEKHAVCGDPHLVDESWHLFGYGDMRPAAGERPLADGRSAKRLASGVTACVCAGVVAAAAWTGVRKARKV
jgi:hypothetical protein